MFLVWAFSKFSEGCTYYFVTFHKCVIYFCVKFTIQKICWQILKMNRPCFFFFVFVFSFFFSPLFWLFTHCSSYLHFGYLLIALATPHSLSSKKVCAMCVQMIIRQFLLLILITTISETELQIKNNREGRDEKNILFTWLYIIMIYNKSSAHMNIIFLTLWWHKMDRYKLWAFKI